MTHAERTSSVRDLYQEVTDRIIAALEAGVAPWVPPYDARVGLPHNGMTGRPYSGINVFLLWMTAQARGYRSPAWYTFRQVHLLGGSVRKGERATLVTYWTARTITDAATEEEKQIPLLRHFHVFNRAQLDGLPDEAMEPERPAWECIAAAERLIQRSGARITEDGPPPRYQPSTDVIHMPLRTAYPSREAYYVDLLHELTHWAGHPTRLARAMTGGFGSPEYAREELVAEMGSAFLCASLGIVGKLHHPEYLGSWLARLREDSRAIFHAASQARQAAEYLLGPSTGTPSERTERNGDGDQPAPMLRRAAA